MKNLQATFFQYLGSLLPQKQSLAVEIADILGISVDAAYRRLRGETGISLEELVVISKQFSISLDTVLALQTGSVSFQVTDFDETPRDFKIYLQQMLDLILQANLFDNKQMYYLCKDLTFFHFYLYPELAAFKTFFWNKTIYNLPEYRTEQFSLKEYPFKECYQLGQRIIAEYNKIPSVEMWHEESLNSTLSQIEYYYHSGYFKTDDEMNQVLDALLNCLNHIQHQLELGYKFSLGTVGEGEGTTLHVHMNEIVIGNNIIQLELNGNRQVFINYSVLGYLHTRDERINNKIMNDFQILLNRSYQISNVGERQRNYFFNRLKKRVKSLKIPLKKHQRKSLNK